MNDSRPPLVRARSQLRALLKSDFVIDELSRSQPSNASFRSFASRNISVLEVRGAPIDLRKDASQSSDVHLLRLQQGALRLTHSEGTTLLAAGDFVAYRGRRAMQFRHEQNIELMTVVLPVRAVERWLPEWQAAEFVVTKQQAEAGLCFDIARDLLVRSPQLKSDNAAEVVGETVARLIARSLALTSLFDAAEPEELTEAQRRRVKHFCRTNLGSAGLCVDAVARATGLSRASLHRLFRDQAQTLMQWVQLERLEACRRLLLDCGFPQRSLTEIALSQGFKSSAHFSAAFRQRYGTTPREYRATARAGRPSRSTLVRL